MLSCGNGRGESALTVGTCGELPEEKLQTVVPAGIRDAFQRWRRGGAEESRGMEGQAGLPLGAGASHESWPSGGGDAAQEGAR